MHYFNRNAANIPISESEYVCAENNDANNNYFHEEQAPIPQSDSADF
jgi:hypothetical protein